MEAGCNVIEGSQSTNIIRAVEQAQPGSIHKDAYGNGDSAEKIADILMKSDN